MPLVEVRWQANAKELRQFGLICVAGFGALGAGLYFGVLPFSAPPEVSVALGVFGAVCGIVGLTFPLALKPLYWTLLVLSYPIGFVVSHLVVGVLFFVVLTPIALVFRLRGRDALYRAFDPGASSYWVARPAVSGDRYFRQF